jgi:hypothetical protein
MYLVLFHSEKPTVAAAPLPYTFYRLAHPQESAGTHGRHA